MVMLDGGSETTKISILTNILPPYRKTLYENLAQQYELRVFLSTTHEDDRGWEEVSTSNALARYEYLNLPRLRSKNGRIFFPRTNIHKMLAGDVFVICGWESPSYLYSLLIAKLFKKKTICFYESHQKAMRFDQGLVSKIRTQILSNFDLVLTPSTMTTKTVTDMGIDPSKIVQTFNTVDVEYFYHLSRKLRESIPSENGHVFLYVGQLIARKNVSSIIKAFDHFSAPDDLLLIVGSGKLKTDLESLSRSLGLSQRVKFLGSLNGEELVRAYARSNTLILASTNEVWGLVVNEALACGLNVVVSSNCGVAEDVKKMSGVYISDNSVQSIGTMMERSRLDWTKHNSNPEILKYNPKRTALDIMRAIELLN